MPKLEYLMIYTTAGLPIYSKCYGTFCKAAFANPELLTGLLSAIETIPPTLSEGLFLQAVKMGSTDMRFSKTFPGNHTIVVGLSADVPEMADVVFEAVNKALQTEPFKSIDWSLITGEDTKKLEAYLINKVLPEALHDYGGFKDECPLGDQCPLHTVGPTSTRQKIWGVFREKYRMLREKMAGHM